MVTGLFSIGNNFILGLRSNISIVDKFVNLNILEILESYYKREQRYNFYINIAI